jgi:hypothetical protein
MGEDGIVWDIGCNKLKVNRCPSLRGFGQGVEDTLHGEGLRHGHAQRLDSMQMVDQVMKSIPRVGSIKKDTGDEKK